MTEPVLFGARYSVYTRIVRLVLAEKKIDCRFQEIDFIADPGDAEKVAGHPFGKVPVLQHGARRFFETIAINCYLDRTFPSPRLLPDDATAMAQVLSVISALDHYIWPSIRELVTQTLFAPLAGGWPDDQVTQRMATRLSQDLPRLEDVFRAASGGTEVTLADLHAAPMFDYLTMVPEGSLLLQQVPELKRWWDEISAQPSLRATGFSLDTYPWAQRDA